MFLTASDIKNSNKYGEGYHFSCTQVDNDTPITTKQDPKPVLTTAQDKTTTDTEIPKYDINEVMAFLEKILLPKII